MRRGDYHSGRYVPEGASCSGCGQHTQYLHKVAADELRLEEFCGTCAEKRPLRSKGITSYAEAMLRASAAENGGRAASVSDYQVREMYLR